LYSLFLITAIRHTLEHFDFFFSSRRRHTRSKRDWSSDVCSSDLSETLTSNLRLTKSITISSPSLINPIGPPAAASGEMCPTATPLVAPENLPSVISATSLPKPLPTMYEVGANISGIPGPPLGPSYLITTT